jgi:hypothetical protein
MNAKRMKAFLGGLALALGASSCATETTTIRTMSEPPQGDQTPAATYQVPKTDPKGMVYVMSLGRESLTSPAGAQALYLHLRIAAEIKSDTSPWTLDAHDQVINLGGGPAQPTYAQGTAGSSVLTVETGKNGTLDLFYALAPGSNAPQAVLSWQVRRGTEVETDATPFALQSAQTPDYAYYQPVGARVEYWPAWWWGVGFYGPWWWGPGWGPYPYWGGYGGYYHRGGFGRGGFGPGYGGFGPGPGRMYPGGHGGGFRVSPAPPPSRGIGGGGGWRGGGGRGFHR